MASTDGTPEHFAEEFRAFLISAGRSAAQLAKDSGLSENTVRNAMKANGFPQIATVEALARSCGNDSRTWVASWHRASNERSRGTASRETLAEQVETLRAEVTALSSQVAELATALTGFKTNATALAPPAEDPEARRRRAFQLFMSELPRPDFRTFRGLFGYRRAYKMNMPDRLLAQVAAISEPQDVEALAKDLASRNWPPQDWGFDGYTCDSVESYVDALRQCLNTYFTNL